MEMTRKQAMIGMLLAACSASGQGIFQQPGIQSLAFDEETSSSIIPKDTFKLATIEGVIKHKPIVMYRVDMVEYEKEYIDRNVFMLEVRADGRVARFTSKEVMDALGGWFEKE